jgi:alkylhydroperoxidase family enzyme
VLWAEHVARNTARERDDVFDEVRGHFSTPELVELTAVCGLFAQSNRFQDSMRLPIEPQHEVDKIRQSVRADPVKLKAYLERLVQYWPAEFPAVKLPQALEKDTGSRTPASSTVTAGPPRVPLVDAQGAGSDSARFIEAAAGLQGGVTNAARTWAHIPNIAKLFLPLFVAFERDGAGSVLPASLRLMAMLTVHHVHRAPYLAAHHTVLARAAGLSSARIAALQSDAAAGSPGFSECEQAVIAWAEMVARNTAKRDDKVIAVLKQHLSDAQVVELTALCAVCSNADLIHNALRIPVERGDDVERLNRLVQIDPARLKAYLQSVTAAWPQVFPVPR